MADHKLRVKVDATDGGRIRFVLTGSLAKQVDLHVLASCANEAVACAARNGCLDRGLALTQPCFDALVGHNLLRDCASAGFGVARTHGRRLEEQTLTTDPLLSFVPSAAEEPALELRGELAARVDLELLSDCANTALACADSNDCLSQGLRIQASCIDALSEHEREAQCLSRGLGFADAALGASQ